MFAASSLLYCFIHSINMKTITVLLLIFILKSHLYNFRMSANQKVLFNNDYWVKKPCEVCYSICLHLNDLLGGAVEEMLTLAWVPKILISLSFQFRSWFSGALHKLEGLGPQVRLCKIYCICHPLLFTETDVPTAPTDDNVATYCSWNWELKRIHWDVSKGIGKNLEATQSHPDTQNKTDLEHV